MANEFVLGFAAAVAALARDCDQPVHAATIIRGAGLALRDFEAAEVDDFDLKPIRALFRTEAQLRTKRGSAARSQRAA
ncbi:hypothetical protein [Methylorubrum thiocyanatum]|uniref:hypothetical protein n=1 Tax=Methylorubrum thiocyanatum TaxID=47958 RepID=UPI003F807CC3